ncbi:MAG: DNA repair protein RecN [Oscillospiraceae bacterium]|nr:DNA repair protein RecN [Oscillospiraceae bacterium]
MKNLLTNLHIENVAVIERADISFSSGFIALTGETGAGKSILIDAVNAVTGERTTRDLIRSGTGLAVISAVFENVGQEAESTLAGLGYPPEDGVVILYRSLDSNGKTAAKINGRTATASMLKEAAATLLNIHGQHDSQRLLQSERHYEFIDLCAQNAGLLSEYAQAYSQLRHIERELNGANQSEEERRKQVELLSFYVEELSAAEIILKEKEALATARRRIQNSESIARSLSDAYAALAGGDELEGAVSLAESAAESLGEAEQYLPENAAFSEKVYGLAAELKDAASEINSLLEDTEFDPEELDRIEERLDLLYRLGKKYGESEEEMLTFLENAQNQLEQLENADLRLQKLEAEHKGVLAKANGLANKLTQSRKTAAEKFARGVCEQLEFLNMPGAGFFVKFEETSLSSTGKDSLEFQITVNRGEPPKPLSKVASGGELSRVMLAIKNVLAEKDGVDTLIFDEIDTGISGRAAQRVAEKLLETSKGRQVICVTHLAQLAALADTHMLIEKNVSGGRTFTTVTPLDKDGRIAELARIIGGAHITEATLKSAEEMLV